ncbi:MAG: hypothetical protein LBI49_17275, partial [Nocardiopsaceae bacterium]|nr:hypothetical protein [Nocardiopsaceae bacterium]
MRSILRHHPASWVAAAVLAAPLAWLGSSAPAAPPAGPPAALPAGGAVSLAAAAAPARSPADTGASDIANLGASGWQVQSSATATQGGAQISAPGFSTAGWLPVSNDDAGAPGTEIEALAQNGKCPLDPALQPVNQGSSGPASIYFANNLQQCYGFMSKLGADTVSQFSVPWWWRTDFTASAQSGQYETLIVNGVIGAANVWLNGTEVATSGQVTGAYTRFTFNVSNLIRAGTNSLAIEVSPNNPQTMFTLDNVDWTQIPPDNSTGIQFPVQLATDGALAAGNAHVTEQNAADLSSSALTVSTDITNNSAADQSGVVTAAITPPGGGAPVTVTQNVTVAAGATQTVTFTPAQYPALTISNPQVWWPYQLGSQPLYTLATSVSQNGTTANSTSETFGIRTVTSYLTGSSAAEPSGARAFKVNGVPIVIRGGGFDPNLLLHYSASDIAQQVALMKNMGLNAIRLEGHIMPSDFFQQMDRAGILVNAGFQCCDAWELQSSGLTSAADFQVMQNSALAIGQSLRDH